MAETEHPKSKSLIAKSKSPIAGNGYTRTMLTIIAIALVVMAL